LSNDGRRTPRQLSMLQLAYGNTGSPSIRVAPESLPSPGFVRYDAGPNIVVVCSPGSSDDLALLWNLRAAHGDGLVLPLGLPLHALDVGAIETLLGHPRIARNGMAHRLAYITSASLSVEAISKRLPQLLNADRPRVAVEPLGEALELGHPGGWHRSDVLVWREGRTQLTPLPADSHRDVFQRGSITT